MLSLSSHALDTTLGKPASDLELTLTCPDGSEIAAITNQDGRCNDWQGNVFTPGLYSIRFATGSYLLKHHDSAFYPYVDVHFEMTENGGHYHIPLLLSPYGFSSYRGS